VNKNVVNCCGLCSFVYFYCHHWCFEQCILQVVFNQ